ncbi:hypothetical protein [Acidihalobacter prosperus]|uniref:hypothetical protein n=1 Tax=Acidihalobacter prosperus TaxID=160660 RepID=UPI0005008069|nr:hypothetical protein [Acidihalobacter prosperus]
MDNKFPDLWDNFIALIRSEFERNGVKYADVPYEKIPFAYLNWLRRSVSPKPRRILKSMEFECPNELVSGLAEIERIIISGDALQPHMSKFLNKASFNDKLLNDWGIYHLHLGFGENKHGKSLLYARFDESNAYFIKIVPRHRLWVDKDTIQILHNNWPSTIQRYRIEGVASDGLGHADAQHAFIRKHNANAFIYLDDGAVYMGPGGGLFCSGDSSRTWKIHDYILIQFEEFDKWVEREKGKTIRSNPSFTMSITRRGGTLWLAVIETNINQLVWTCEVSLD